MATPIIMPKFGQMTEESAIVEWLKKEGDKIAKGDILFTVETDKSVMEVESFDDGTLLKILVPPGRHGARAIAGRFPRPTGGGDSARGGAGSGGAETGGKWLCCPRRLRNQPQRHGQLNLSPRSAAAVAPVSTPAAPALFRISPRAAALARHSVIDPAPIKGSGPLGRVVERDVKKYLEARGYGKLRVSPAAKELAAKEDVDLLAVVSADGGRIGVADVQRAIAEKPKPMSKMRQIIAQRLTQSIVTQPHFYVHGQRGHDGVD